MTSPRDVFRRIAHLPNCLFFESGMRHETLGRYSFVMADPIHTHRGVDLPARMSGPADDACWADPELPPFQGGWAGLLGYELAHQYEELPRGLADEFELTPVVLGYYDVVVAFDHLTDRAWIIAHAPTQPLGDQRPDPSQRLDFFLGLLSGDEVARPQPTVSDLKTATLSPEVLQKVRSGLYSNFSSDQYRQAVADVVEYIRAGDVFQVNLSQRLLTRCQEDPVDLYLRLSAATPAPFSAFFDAGHFQVLSVSPERFFSVRAGRVEARPIKGTRRLTGDEAEDQRLGRELEHDPKERAENTMIVDLIRNDLSRACDPASVQVSKLCGLERYGYVQHLVSVVRGQLRPEATAVELLAQAFPGGSVTGAPKVRAMEIISERERVVRGPYCGALGYFGAGPGADCDTSILIRTATLSRGWLQIPVGGGIVADSDPDAEYEETWTKAEPFRRSGVTQRGQNDSA